MKTSSPYIFLLLTFLLLVSGATAETVQVQNAKVNTIGATVPVNIILDTSPAGIAGYDITVSLSNHTVATITNVSFPSWAKLNDSTVFPSPSVRLRTVDLYEEVTSGATDIPLGTITLRGDAVGSTDVVVTVKNVTADGGSSFTPGVLPGKFTVDSGRLQSIIVNHTSAHLSQIPKAALDQARSNLHIAYGHTSHGSQVTDGMTGLESFSNAPYGSTTYLWNDGPSAGALDLDDYFVDGDLGNPDRTTWADRTRVYLNEPANSDVNVVMWSWCGEADASESDINTYLNLMNQLETEYPDVTFVYMTGHLVGSGQAGNLNQRNEQIRTYARTNNKVLFDFADIESFDPDGLTNFMLLNADDNCTYNNNIRYNWAAEWQKSHIKGVDWYDCNAAHSQPLNGNQKAYAAWWLWARLGGWDGNPASGGAAELGVYRPSTSTFYLRPGNFPATGPTIIGWGVSTDLPVTGDWNGDGKREVGIYRPSTSTFYLRPGNFPATGPTVISWGVSTDLPVTGDWNGDGTTDVGIYRPSTSTFYLRPSNFPATGPTVIGWGVNTDLPVTGDWNGDGTTDVGIYRPSTSTFYLRPSNFPATGPTVISWGVNTDLPATGDWNGDGTTDVGIYRPSASTFYLRPSSFPSTGPTILGWGISTDRPVTGKW